MLDITKDKKLLRFCFDKTILVIFAWITMLIPTGATQGNLNPVRGVSALFNITMLIASGVIVLIVGIHYFMLFLYFKRYEEKSAKGMYGTIINLIMGIGYFLLGIILLYETVMNYVYIQQSATSATTLIQELGLIIVFIIQIPVLYMDKKIIKKLNSSL